MQPFYCIISVKDINKQERVVNMKKLLLPIFSFIFVCSSYMNIFANSVSENAEKYLISVKERIGDTSSYKEFSSRTNEVRGKTTYFFEWYSNEENNSRFLSVNCTESGIITSLNSYDGSYEKVNKPSIKKVSYDEAIAVAKEFIERLNPDIYKNLKVSKYLKNENPFSNEYTFKIDRIENGLVVSGNSGDITLNKTLDRVVNFSLNYTEDVEFQSFEKNISSDKALELYREKLGTELKYLSAYKDKNLLIIPCYTEKNTNNNKYINANTGEIFELTQNEIVFGENKSSSMLDKEMVSSGSGLRTEFTEVELEELSKLSNLMTKDEVIKELESNKFIPLSKEFELTNFNLSEDYFNKDKKYYNLSFSKKVDNNSSYINYTVNAKNGQITHYFLQIPQGSKSKNIKDKNYTYRVLTDSIKGLAGNLYSEYKEKKYIYPDNTVENNIASVDYVRLINDTPYENDFIRVRYDIKENKIISYSLSYTDEEFPSIENVISEDNLYEIIKGNITYDLKYVISNNKGIPVYMFDEEKNILFNALDGKMLDYSLNEFKETLLTYEDIENHYAKDIILKLSEYGIGFNEKTFRPDDHIKQKDYISLIVSTFYHNRPVVIEKDNDYNDSYSTAKRLGIIKDYEISKDSLVSRKDAAKFMVRAMGDGDIASLENIFILPFKDVTQNIGYISILKEMKIVSGDENGNFNPDDLLKRAESVIMIYNYLIK